MIFVTGDTHGNAMHRLSMCAFPEQKEMNADKESFVIVCGDFGCVWSGSRAEDYQLDWLNDKPFKTLFVDGNHENYDLLKTYQIKEWHGGQVQFIRPNVVHLMRGEIYEIEGKTFFVFGGARSHDIRDGVLEIGDSRIKKWSKDYTKLFRVNHVSWWEEEMPSDDEMRHGIENLNRVGNKADFIITHCCASSTQALMSHGAYTPDELTNYLENIRQNTNFKRWFFGHYHDNKMINSEEILLYDQIVRIV